ncbi:MAG: hypothetical protein V1821_02135 [bacterium]
MHQDSIYRRTLFEALRFSWYNPKLWLFGLFAGLLNAGGFWEVFSGAKKLTEESFSIWSLGDVVFPGFSSFESIQTMVRVNSLSLGLTLTSVAVIVILLALVIYLSLSSQGALIAATSD